MACLFRERAILFLYSDVFLSDFEHIISRNCCNFVNVLNKRIKYTFMARPIAETPVLTDEDALRFERMRLEVENLSKEERAENTKKLQESVKKALSYITVCI